MDLEGLKQFLASTGKGVNEYLNNVSTATAPGATNDLASFVKNELTKYPGTRDADPNAPTFDTVNNVITNLLGLTGANDPLSQVGGPSSAMLGPIGRVKAMGKPGELIHIAPGEAKAVNQAQKKIVKALFRGDPETLKEVVQSPRMMHVGVPGAGSNLSTENTQQLLNSVMEGAFAHFQPGGKLGGTVRFHPATMRGVDPNSGRLLKRAGVEGVPDMAVHEATHFLNEPGFRQAQEGTSALDLTRLAEAIQPFTSHAKFGPRIISQHIAKGRPDIAMNEALSYLSQPTGRGPGATWLNAALTGRERSGGIDQFKDAPSVKNLLQEALDAAMRVPGVRREAQSVTAKRDDILDMFRRALGMGGK